MPPLPGWLKPDMVLEHVSWFNGQDFRMKLHLQRQAELAARGIEHHLILNDPAEESLRIRYGVRGGLFSRNQYVNERIFRPIETPKRYDAIYIARLRPFKRHALACRIARLAVLTDDGGDLAAFAPEVAHGMTNDRKLKPAEVAGFINSASVGLCLSEEEGAVRAVVEKLLCGLPMVSTPSRGGREEFLDETNCRVVDPDAGAILDAVREWLAKPPPAAELSIATLERLERIRNDFCKYIARIIYHRGGPEYEPLHLHERYFSPPRGIEARGIMRRALPRRHDLAPFTLD